MAAKLGVIHMELVFQACKLKGFRVMDVYSEFQRTLKSGIGSRVGLSSWSY